MAGENTPSLAEIQSLVEEQGVAFEAFKAANDERLKQIEETGSADPVTVEKVEKANEALGELSAKVDKLIEAANDNEKTAERLTALEGDLEEARDRADRLETTLKRTPRSANDNDPEADFVKSVAGFFTAKRIERAHGERVEPVRPSEVTDEQVEAFKAYETAFRHYIRYSSDKFGNDLSPELRKELSVGIEADGGYWVIPEISSRVFRRLFETSPMRSIANVVTISTDAIEFPTDTNSAVSGGWVGEKDSRPETATPQVGTMRIPVHEQYAAPHATQKLLDDASFPAEQWLGDKIADILRRTENTAFLTGNGVSRPRGLLDYEDAATTDADADRSWGVLQYVASGDASGFATDPNGPDALIDLIHALNPAYRARARWLTNRATLGTVRKMQDSNGMYIWQMGNIQVGQPSSLLGFPITEAEDMPDVAAGVGAMAFGDFAEGYTIVDRQGIRVLRDPYTSKPFVEFYTTKRVGGDVTNFDAIKILRIAAN